MKKSFIIAAVCTVLFASCKFEINGGAIIEPSSNIVKNEYKLAKFDKLDIDVVANVKFIQGQENDYRVVLSCPDNYVDLFDFEVEHDGELNIDFKRDKVNISAQNVDITVYSPGLKRLENSGVASVEIDKLNAYELEVDNSGVGGIYISGLEVKQLEADCSGVGNIELAGVAQQAELDCSGVGSIKAGDLKATRVKADVSGVGGITCNATERIEAEVSGVGSLKYTGQPHEKQLQRTGVGDITEF
jgi:hypothetical protein